jgi:FkbM family methyltransferase
MSTTLLHATELGERLRQVTRSFLPRRIYSWASCLLDAISGTKLMGRKQFMEFRSKSSFPRSFPGDLEQVILPNIQHPIFFRPGTSDVGEIVHSCIRNAYSMYLPGGDVRLIIDAGANIGDTTVWYLNKFPRAMVLAVEPDADNFRVLAKNCAPYGPRAIPLRAALWPTEAEKLTIRPSAMASGISIDCCGDAGGGECAGVSMSSLLNMVGASELDIFKCDIEGTERLVFSAGSVEWLRRTRQIAIELHSPECEMAVFTATSNCQFEHFRYRDLNVFRRVG